MSFPCRYSDMIHHFARPVPVLSMVTNQVVDYIYQAQGHKIMQWNNQKDQHSHQCHKEAGGCPTSTEGKSLTKHNTPHIT